jgi:hypothetical protein
MCSIQHEADTEILLEDYDIVVACRIERVSERTSSQECFSNEEICSAIKAHRNN